MANPLCGNVERRIDCASYGLFDSCNYTMVVRHDHRRALRFRFGLVIYLAKGGPKSGDAPYVIPSGIITGALTGLFIVMWAIKTT
jgi:hypothetical protein